MSNILEDVSRIGKQLIIKEPFYGIFLSTLNKVIRTDLDTAGVSKSNINYQLAINPEFWGSLDNDNKKIGLLKHELLHIAFNHLLDRGNFPNHQLHNIAADIEINQYIEPQYYPADNLLLPSTFPELNLPLKAGTKKYYELLQQAYGQNTSDTLNDLMGESDFHMTWEEFEGLSEGDKKLIKSQIDHQIKNIAESNRDQGFIPSELKGYIDSLFEITPQSYDWKSYFRRFFSSGIKTYTKKTRRKLNKRFSENPALKIKTKQNILIGIDTSGSVNEKDLIEFFNEIHHIHKSGVSITIAEGDADIHNVYEYKGKTPESVQGRGGTDMNPFIEYFNKNKQYTNLIILTDGFIGSNTVKTFRPTLMVLCSNGAPVEEVKENGWGSIIKINLAS
jgi:predicted metal-dependent peptidase